MVWCSYCAKDQVAERDDTVGFTCCTECGRVLADDAFSNELTFTNTANGSSRPEGSFIPGNALSRIPRISHGKQVLSFQSDSHEKTLNKGKHELEEIAERLLIQPRTTIIEGAHRFYTMAAERNFTRGRRLPQVAAACLYIICRQENKPYMLIDFSDSIQTNVYILGTVFLQLCQLLRLEQHAMMARPVDPSLFIHRFAARLQFDTKMHAVANSALRLVASMKRDWMLTGRRPSGICGAALFIAAHIHGFERSKSDITSVVHISESTLRQRLVEFQRTDSSNLTAEEFNSRAKEIETSAHLFEGITNTSRLTCEHKEAQHHAHGLCRACYDEFVKVSGGMSHGGAHPPAFTEAQKKAAAEKHEDSTVAEDTENLIPESEDPENPVTASEETGNPTTALIDVSRDYATQGVADDEGTLSDIDDEEVEGYLHNDEEVRLKTIIWTEMNKEYLEIQEAKAAAMNLVPEEARVKKVIKRKRVEEPVVAESAAEAARGMLASKKLNSSKWNHGVLENLFNQETKEKEEAYDQGLNKTQEQNVENNMQVEVEKVDKDIGNEEEDDEEFEGHTTVNDEEEYYDEYE